MSLGILANKGKHRAVDKLAELRDENRRLLTIVAGADDFFAIQTELITSLEADVRNLKRQLSDETAARINAEKDAAARARWVRDLESHVAELTRRLDIATKATAAADETQEIYLGASPFASTNPAHIPAT